MVSIASHIKKDLFGYIALLAFIVFIAASHLLSLAVYFLFLYLFTDICTNEINRKIPALHKTLLFWLMVVIIVAAVAIFVIIISPLFARDFPLYFSLLHDKTISFINTVSSRFDITIDSKAIEDAVVSESTKSLGFALKMINHISKELIFFVFAFVLNMLLYLERKAISHAFNDRQSSLLAYMFQFCAIRFKRFYGYFRKVMIGQFFISLINTLVTLIVIVSIGLPHKVTLLCIVFLCGLIPVVGNLIANTILSVTALITSGIPACIICLVLLVGAHKLEYFLNGKIIGTIIRLPMFVTLLSLLAGEALLGIFGMIVAIPFVLTLRDELNGIPVETNVRSGCADTTDTDVVE